MAFTYPVQPVPDDWQVGDRVVYVSLASGEKIAGRITHIDRPNGRVMVGNQFDATIPLANLVWTRVAKNLTLRSRKRQETRKRRQAPATVEWSAMRIAIHKDVAEWITALELTGHIKDRHEWINQLLRKELDKLKTKKGI